MQYLRLDHVDPAWAELSHAIIDVHHTLTLSHVQHDVNDDKAARTASASTESQIDVSCVRKPKGKRNHTEYRENCENHNTIIYFSLRLLSKKKRHVFDPDSYRMALSLFSDLQWTTIGPALAGLLDLTLRMKPSRPVAWYGTPWSGQPVKWNCLISLISWAPRCSEQTSKHTHIHTKRVYEWGLLAHCFFPTPTSIISKHRRCLCVCVCLKVCAFVGG